MGSPSDTGEGPARPLGAVDRLRAWRFEARRDSQQLQAEIAIAREQLACDEPQPHDASAPWNAIACDQLKRASKALDGRNLLAARRWLMAAQQALLPGLTPAELQAKAIELRAQARTELGGWQGAAIENLLAPTAVDLPTAVRASLEIRDARLLDTGTEAARRHAQLGRRLVALVALVVAIWVLALLRVGQLDPGMVTGVIGFGALGGAFSTAIATHQGDPTPSTSDSYVSNWVTWARPAIGAAGALGAYALLGAAVGVAVSSPLAIFAIAFAAGFSERLVASTAEGTTIPTGG